jgi:hypothetical protein
MPFVTVVCVLAAVALSDAGAKQKNDFFSLSLSLFLTR